MGRPGGRASRAREHGLAVSATDQDLVIKAIEEAARQLRVTAPFRALLPALPGVRAA